ncbi:unnamed protein product [Durusdinium trenchii]|uniref:Uncharacterized protein n=1 Tax=Durusdinium trenchii TaxID=1381693 RepID=A0ABP0MVF7_9DINO
MIFIHLELRPLCPQTLPQVLRKLARVFKNGQKPSLRSLKRRRIESHNCAANLKGEDGHFVLQHAGLRDSTPLDADGRLLHARSDFQPCGIFEATAGMEKRLAIVLLAVILQIVGRFGCTISSGVCLGSDDDDDDDSSSDSLHLTRLRNADATDFR